MKEYVLERKQLLPAGIEEAFDFFSKAENLEAITPPFLNFETTTPGPIEMEVGTLIRYKLRLRGIPLSWLTRIDEWNPPHSFVDRQLKGPYALWHHTHTFEEIDDEHTSMTDRVRYGLPLGPLGAIAREVLVKRDLDRIFDHRYTKIEEMLTADEVNR
ncbi:MAG: SRPBCC family protein [Solirubrobacterales bacterium]